MKRVIAAGTLAIILVGCARNTSTPAAPSSTPSPTKAAVAVPTVAASAGVTPGAPAVFDTRTIASEFALPMKATLPPGWKAFHDILGALGFVNVGVPERPDSTWWGPDLLLVEDAQIHDPSDVVSSKPATADRSRFVPWPADFMKYITGLPEVTVVSGPKPITIGGVMGMDIIVMTPAMHPLVWLKDDFAWLGGGKTGVDGPAERRFVILDTGGHKLLISLANDPSTFDARNAELQKILESVSFE